MLSRSLCVVDEGMSRAELADFTVITMVQLFGLSGTVIAPRAVHTWTDNRVVKAQVSGSPGFGFSPQCKGKDMAAK